MQLFDGDPVEAVCLSPRTRSTLFGSCCRKALVHHANCRTLPAGMSRWFCQILIGMSGSVAVATHRLSHNVSFSGVRPKGWTGLGGSFDRLPSLVVLELRGAQVAER